MAVRREVLGDEHVDRATAAATDLTSDFQEFITEYAWGGIWTRPGLDRRARSLVTLTALVARGHHEELAMHVRAARTNGVTVEEIKEVLLQTAIYCGVPDANTAFRIAQRCSASWGRPSLGGMTSLEGRPRTALLVVDVQNGIVGNAFERDRVVANIRALVDRARDEGVPVVWVQHSDDEELTKGSEEWAYVPELVRRDTEPLVHKTYPDSFEATDLEALLAEHGVGRLVVTGAQTEECIRSTLHGALVRGYDATLVADAHTTEDLREWGFPVSPAQSIAYTNAYWSWASAPDRTGSVTPTAEVDFSTR